MDHVEINNADTTKEPTDINRDQVLVEETANPTNLTQLKEVCAKNCFFLEQFHYLIVFLT